MRRLARIFCLLAAAWLVGSCGAAALPAPAASGSGAQTTVAANDSPRLLRVRRRYHRRRHARVRLPKAPTADRIEEIQAGLARSGYYKGDPTGKWDANTINAMKRFQEANGLTPTGKIDALSLQKLGLGSDVAGLSAPDPNPPATPPAPTPHE